MHVPIARALDTVTLRVRLLATLIPGAMLSACGTGDATDPILHRVLVVDPGDGTVLPISREGAGPGEFRRPEAIAISDTAVLVLDFGNRRVQRLGADGAPVGTTRVPAVIYLPAAIDPQGALAIPALGLDSSLATFFVPADSETLRLRVGEPLADPPRMIAHSVIRYVTLPNEAVLVGVTLPESRSPRCSSMCMISRSRQSRSGASRALPRGGVPRPSRPLFAGGARGGD